MRADIRVCLRGGRHTRTATFDLAETDSGSNGFKVVYQAYPGETPCGLCLRADGVEPAAALGQSFGMATRIEDASHRMYRGRVTIDADTASGNGLLGCIC
ncbi:hypothetical protein SCANM124S_00242 [Streptomyces canus]